MLTDESLIAGLAAGDPEAVAAFVARFQGRVYGLALSVVADRGLAEEVAQEAFVRAWLHAATFDPARGEVAGWLLTITRNLAVDAVRRRRDQPVPPERLPLGATRPVTTVEDAQALTEGLRSLPAVQGRAVVLAGYYGLTAREVADREGVPLGTAKSRIRRGLAHLRLVLTDRGR
ncbi:sigma-70 family RNA polymerase sigma factor [Actinomadura barringtoniae]|uniref:Sigma-70 family RNA polymerase sigma factor n=1 Tax=Actinomadura barringtoniae TaxID=1427535 RepID=A0A939PKA7_9ACTN|nr:sigma-70 family RNA polymerase sigma factor [Actinomadura barringtoniae]MBO2453688.1 sigma-70 family RNA polymerase sigma factor [Actinomadura barringtoniae]